MKRRQFLKDAVATGAVAAGCAGVGGFVLKEAESVEAPLRPPGALAEEEFLSRCIRCLRCVEACPNNALLPLDDSLGRHRQSTPTLKPRRQACMLCMGVPGDFLRCTEACPSGALQLIEKELDAIEEKVSIGVAEIDLALCYSYNNWSCGTCFYACPLPGKAITLGLWERPTIHPEACIGCGLCERACIRYPHAIRVRRGGAR